MGTPQTEKRAVNTFTKTGWPILEQPLNVRLAHHGVCAFLEGLCYFCQAASGGTVSASGSQGSGRLPVPIQDAIPRKSNNGLIGSSRCPAMIQLGGILPAISDSTSESLL
jgi:hypothetical protein